ncbi:hypothetical protein N1851_005277 [Merluccius polli]|uniref:Uncharacterized protein n=1 Tax=Merluccius polli TaxID=89951 RepID=A0AA47N720_MERPO|nr:hypothetical protein N1851_005277 [Merluccius polli]
MFRQSKYAYDDVSSLNPRTVGGRDRGGLDATVGDVSAMCGGPDMSVISTSTMKSYCHRLHQRPSHCQSPAKVFAKLKANVSRPHDGGTRAYGDARDRERERGGSALFTPRKVNATWTESNETYSVGSDSAEALTVSPTRTTPRPVPPRSSSHLRSQRAESPPMEDMRTRLVGRRAYTPMETPGQVTAHVFKSPKSRPSSRSSKDLVRSPSKGQPQQFSSAEGGGRAAIESVLSLERCPSMSPAKMFAHIKEKEIRRMREHYDSPTRKFTNGEAVISLERCPLTSPAKMFAHIKEREIRRMREHYDSPTRKFTNGEAVISLERCPLMSPAKMIAHIKEREREKMRENYDSPTRKFTNREDQVFLENRASPANVFPHMKQRKRHQQKEADDVRGNTKELRNTELASRSGRRRGGSEQRDASVQSDEES